MPVSAPGTRHVAVSNKVQDATGRWLAVAGRVLYTANVTLSETYNTLIEGELVARLGVEFAARETVEGKRVLCEKVGVDDRVPRPARGLLAGHPRPRRRADRRLR